MIETNLYKTRTRDGVKVYTRFSMAYVELATMKYVSEIPEPHLTLVFRDETVNMIEYRCIIVKV